MTWTTTLGCTAALAIAAIASVTSWTGNSHAQTVLSSNAVDREEGMQPSRIQATDNALGQTATLIPDQPTAANSPAKKPSTPSEPAVAAATATLRASLEAQMLTPADFSISGATISNLASQLREATGLPIVVDPRGIEVASELRPNPTFTLEASGLPLQVALQELLRPSALRAEVRDNSVVITADSAELARHGIGTSVWINVDEDAAKMISEALSSQITEELVEVPLDEALRMIGEKVGIPITLDIQSLDAAGLTPDAPVSASVQDLQLRTLLDQILAPLELAYSYRRESLVVASADSHEEHPLQRIYFLDGLGMNPRELDFDSIVMAIQQTIDPDTWDTMGGTSTMIPIVLSLEQRPSLMVATNLSTHEQIESLINTLRKTNLGPDVGTSPPLNKRNIEPSGGGMGGGGGGGGGMF